jgi:hypothetical protein
MKAIASAVALCFLFVIVGQAQTKPAPSPQPTPLEAFARQPATHIAWSKEVGRFDSSEAHAVVTALILEDKAQRPHQMRGVRIDLSSQDSKDEVYLGEGTLGRYKSALDEISRNIPGSRNSARDGLVPGGTSYLGSCIFWNSNNTPRVHALNATYYFASHSEGVSLSALKEAEFRFPKQDPSQFSAAIALAIDQLKGR